MSTFVFYWLEVHFCPPTLDNLWVSSLLISINLLSYLGTSQDASLCSSGWGGDCVNKQIPGSVPVELSVGWDRESASVSYTIGGAGFRLKFSKASKSSSLELDTVVTLEIRLCRWLPIWKRQHIHIEFSLCKISNCIKYKYECSSFHLPYLSKPKRHKRYIAEQLERNWDI